jgi:PadR family transcriptional regulator, regulatory protein PadR
MNLKGSLPLLILHTLGDGPKHGYLIAKQIKQQSQGVLDFKEGTLYPTLHGLEKRGYVEAFSEEENGRIRRYYRLTDSGHGALVSEAEQWTRYSKAINMILKGSVS